MKKIVLWALYVPSAVIAFISACMVVILSLVGGVGMIGTPALSFVLSAPVAIISLKYLLREML